MASPPHRSSATSPTYPSPSALPGRKRTLPSISTSAPYPVKRANTSFSATSSSHPLRQTSFPPEEGQYGERSPSVDSIVTAGTGARSVTASVTKPKKRGRKRKEDTQSVRSNTARETARDTASRTSRGGPADDEQEIEEDDEVDRAVDDLVQTGTKVNDEHEQQRIAVLLSAFDVDQSERYDLHRRVKLKKETVRKIVNQTLSQSVPPSVITTINGFTKVFLAELIERARDVQMQSVQAAERALPTPPDSSADATPAPGIQAEAGPRRSSYDGLPLKTESGYMGPLLPDHFREAFRRYRQNGEGFGVGVEGRSVGLGVTGSVAARLGGRRLFR